MTNILCWGCLYLCLVSVIWAYSKKSLIFYDYVCIYAVCVDTINSSFNSQVKKEVEIKNKHLNYVGNMKCFHFMWTRRVIWNETMTNPLLYKRILQYKIHGWSFDTFIDDFELFGFKPYLLFNVIKINICVSASMCDVSERLRISQMTQLSPDVR